MIHDILNGLRVLVVEDELLIAMLIEDTLMTQSCKVLGPFNTVASALTAVRTQAVDLAVLDVNVRGEKIYPVAEILAARHIPFILLSGYGDDAVPAEHPDWRAHAKPFHVDALTEVLARRVMQV